MAPWLGRRRIDACVAIDMAAWCGIWYEPRLEADAAVEVPGEIFLEDALVGDGTGDGHGDLFLFGRIFSTQFHSLCLSFSISISLSLSLSHPT